MREEGRTVIPYSGSALQLGLFWKAEQQDGGGPSHCQLLQPGRETDERDPGQAAAIQGTALTKPTRSLWGSPWARYHKRI